MVTWYGVNALPLLLKSFFSPPPKMEVGRGGRPWIHIAEGSWVIWTVFPSLQQSHPEMKNSLDHRLVDLLNNGNLTSQDSVAPERR